MQVRILYTCPTKSHIATRLKRDISYLREVHIVLVCLLTLKNLITLHIFYLYKVYLQKAVIYTKQKQPACMAVKKYEAI